MGGEIERLKSPKKKRHHKSESTEKSLKGRFKGWNTKLFKLNKSTNTKHFGHIWHCKICRVENNLKSPLYSHWKQDTHGKLRWPSKHVRKTVILDTRKTDTCCTNVFQINLKRITKLNQNKTLETTFSFLFARFLKCGHELSHNCWL